MSLLIQASGLVGSMVEGTWRWDNIFLVWGLLERLFSQGESVVERMKVETIKQEFHS